MKKKLKVAISLGDPNGIGAEIILKSLLRRDLKNLASYTIFCPHSLWKYYLNTFDISLPYQLCKDLNNLHFDKINIVDFNVENFSVEFGKKTNQAGSIALTSLQNAANAVKEKQLDVLVTAPINKSNIQSDSFQFPGHTEFLENVWGGNNLMFMVHDHIKVGLVTQHIPINQVSQQINREIIINKYNLINSSLQTDFGIAKPIIAVLGLNPHAGDHGLLGKEEEQTIMPAIKSLLEKGNKAFGPFPSDSFFSLSNLKTYDAVLAMYHDQGLIPFKTIAGIEGVNYTAGLPFVRTSPDHGVGYDIADKNMADSGSMTAAIHLAIRIYKQRALEMELKENRILPQNTGNQKNNFNK